MLGRRRPNVPKLARKRDVAGLVAALSYRDVVTDRDGRAYDLGASVRRDAAHALAPLADASAGVDVGAALIRALGDASGDVREGAARALAARPDLRAVPALATAALSPAGSPHAPAAAAADALVQHSGADSVAQFTTILLHSESDLQPGLDILARMIGTVGGDVAAYVSSAAMLALSHGGGEVPERAADVLVWLGADSVEPLLSFVESGNGARPAAIRALGRLGDQSCGEALVKCLSDEDPAVRQAAAAALGDMSDPRFAPALLAASADHDYGVRKAALEAAQKLGQISGVAEVPPSAELQ
jgi:HEAT repeat protein